MAGHMITRILQETHLYEVIDICHTRRLDNTSILMDVRNIRKVKELINKQTPDIIINCIGILNNQAKENPADAIFLNSYFPKFLESYCLNKKNKIIHLSTDCVFSGKEGQYTENAGRNGKSIYAQTKILGEIKNNKDLTIRTSIIGPELNENGSGLFHWFMNQTGKIKGFSQVIWSGLTTLQLAISINNMIESNVTSLYHLVPAKSITKYRLLNIIKQVFNKNIVIQRQDDPVSDKSLINTRRDYIAIIPSYEKMIVQLKEYMIRNKKIYTKYF
ncbi:sugar nucleotide-binding protein [Iocasia frigidifontis]|uniref:dTDP-4-dehydrorhamnose reductase n=2 Tax=Iocasia fonsfrigidae TaxID=2682810 RepID=A0A8A7KDR4_9FIRM|nr:sugar nucleotide-binding protein [Iocasia fonsfrigidae]